MSRLIKELQLKLLKSSINVSDLSDRFNEENEYVVTGSISLPMCSMVFNRKFKVFNDFSLSLARKIKVYYIPRVNEVLIVTFDDSVYHYTDAKGCVQIIELRSKQVIKFCCGDHHYIALTDSGYVYTWGRNYNGQSGDGTSLNYYKPKLISALNGCYIISISCGDNHTLALSCDGFVYSFGANNFGQCGHNSNDIDSLMPVKLDLTQSAKIIAISCGSCHSTALTTNGNVFVWGSNRWGQLGIGLANEKESEEHDALNYKTFAVELDVPKIKQIICGVFCTLMLSNDGDIYYCGSDQLVRQTAYDRPTKINVGIKFTEIAASIHTSLCAASSDDKCYIFCKYGNEDNNNLQLSVINSIKETYAYYEHISYKTVTIQTTKYSDGFIEITALGSGGFSTVYKSQHKIDDNYYAIKKVSFASDKKEEVFKELNFLTQLKSDFIVKYFDAWVEDNYYIGLEGKNICNDLIAIKKPLLLHIQMELCSFTLRDVINKLSELLTNNSTVSLIGYYIASELFFEVLECVQYIHSQNPSVIHRDLKPENILITNFSNYRFVRLADFGLSTFHVSADQSHTKYKGTARYRAPELSYTTNYTTKIDMYSLGLIAQELFYFKISDPELKCEREIRNKMNFMRDLVIKLLSPEPDIRPNCGKILDRNDRWCITKNEILRDERFNQIFHKIVTIEESFLEFYVQKKYETMSYNRITKNTSLLTKFRSIINF